jgi:hypothetical protein
LHQHGGAKGEDPVVHADHLASFMVSLPGGALLTLSRNLTIWTSIQNLAEDPHAPF